MSKSSKSTTTYVIQKACLKCMDMAASLGHTLKTGDLDRILASCADPSGEFESGVIQSSPDVGFVLCLVAGFSLAELKRFMWCEYNVASVEPLFEKYLGNPEFAAAVKIFAFANALRGTLGNTAQDSACGETLRFLDNARRSAARASFDSMAFTPDLARLFFAEGPLERSKAIPDSSPPPPRSQTPPFQPVQSFNPPHIPQPRQSSPEQSVKTQTQQFKPPPLPPQYNKVQPDYQWAPQQKNQINSQPQFNQQLPPPPFVQQKQQQQQPPPPPFVQQKQQQQQQPSQPSIQQQAHEKEKPLQQLNCHQQQPPQPPQNQQQQPPQSNQQQAHEQEHLMNERRSPSPAPPPTSSSPPPQSKPPEGKPQRSNANDKKNKKGSPKDDSKDKPPAPGKDDSLKSVESVTVKPAPPWNGKANLQITRPGKKAPGIPKNTLEKKSIRYVGKDVYGKYLKEGERIEMKKYYFCNGTMECNGFELFLNDGKRYPVFLDNMQAGLFKDHKYIKGIIKSIECITVTQECNRYSIYKGGVFYIVKLSDAKEIPPPSK